MIDYRLRFARSSSRNRPLLRFAPLPVLLSLALLAGCRRAPSFEPYRRDAAAFAAESRPRYERLAAQLPALVQRAAKVHAASPDAAALQQKVARARQTATFLAAAIDGLPGKIESAIKTGKPDEVAVTLHVARTEIGTRLSALRLELEATSADLALVERHGGAPGSDLLTDEREAAAPPPTAAAAAAAGALSK
jgi:hypothetical protein